MGPILCRSFSSVYSQHSRHCVSDQSYFSAQCPPGFPFRLIVKAKVITLTHRLCMICHLLPSWLHSLLLRNLLPHHQERGLSMVSLGPLHWAGGPSALHTLTPENRASFPTSVTSSFKGSLPGYPTPSQNPCSSNLTLLSALSSSLTLITTRHPVCFTSSWLSPVSCDRMCKLHKGRDFSSVLFTISLQVLSR